MRLVIRPTTEADVAAAEQCLTDGKAALAALGVPQWQSDYPNRIDIEEDMGHGASFVAVDGAWLTDSASSAPRYAVIHRCAVSAQASRRGVMSQMFLEGERLARAHGCESMRIDTHMRNVGLRGLAEKLGYTRCGTITLPYPEESDPLRIAFEKLL